MNEIIEIQQKPAKNTQIFMAIELINSNYDYVCLFPLFLNTSGIFMITIGRCLIRRTPQATLQSVLSYLPKHYDIKTPAVFL